MKKIAHFLLILLVLCGLGGTLWLGVRKQKEKPQTEETVKPAATTQGTAPTAPDKSEELGVKLEKEKWQALELETKKPEKMESTPHRLAFGRVLNPAPLITLDGELSAAEAALALSKAERDRAQGLFKNGENIARKAMEIAEAQYRADAIKVNGLRRTALVEWGPGFANLNAEQRREFVERLVRGDVALVRVDILPGDALTELPKSARVLVLGREQQPLETRDIRPAADIDAKTQAQGFILHMEKSPFPLRPGMALTAWLELPEPPRPGFAIPRPAILRHDGRTWVYVQEGEDKFVRKPVTLDTPLEDDKGWFVPEKGGIKAEDHLVITGAQSLLSEELKAQGGGAD